MGKTPKDLAITLKDNDWSELDKVKNTPLYEEAEKIKNMFAMKFLTAMVGGPKSINQQSKTTCSSIVNKLTNNCLTMTKASRDFMENNPQKKLPKDFKQYPGKMDHSTVIAFKIGSEERPPTPKNPVSNGSGWQEFTTETGEKYFFNPDTGQSSWEGKTFFFFYKSTKKQFFDDGFFFYFH